MVSVGSHFHNVLPLQRRRPDNLRRSRIGDVNNLVFSCGAVLEPTGEFRLYYGGSDSCMCVGSAPVKKIVRRCLGRHGGGKD